jgi:hypothetical protein
VFLSLSQLYMEFRAVAESCAAVGATHQVKFTLSNQMQQLTSSLPVFLLIRNPFSVHAGSPICII